MSDTLFATAFSLWGAPTNWLEVLAFALALGMVACNIRVIHWGWPLAAISSLLYGLLFARYRLYGEASLQVFFAAMAAWGWWQWLRGTTASGAALTVRHLSPSGRQTALLAAAVLWLLIGLLLDHFTDSDVPWLDAFPTALSIVAQVLLGRKLLENWPFWVVVNLSSVGLFAYKALWLTALLYLVFTFLSLVGWRAWQTLIERAPKVP